MKIITYANRFITGVTASTSKLGCPKLLISTVERWIPEEPRISSSIEHEGKYVLSFWDESVHEMAPVALIEPTTSEETLALQGVHYTLQNKDQWSMLLVPLKDL